MKLYEHQAKDVFAKAGIPIPRGILAVDEAQAEAAGETIGYPCVAKAQVLSGGRGKAGLIRLARGQAQLKEAAKTIFAAPQKVRLLLIEEAVDFENEIYLAVTADPAGGGALLLACAEGGIDIEELARTAPEKILKTHVPLSESLMPFRARDLAYSLGFSGEKAKQFAAIAQSLYAVFRAQDAELAEINPLFAVKSGGFVAGDGKLSVDDNSLNLHPEWEPQAGDFDSETAFEAYKEGIPYLQFDGDISLMCAGAGLTTTVYDLIADAGGTVANYLEFGGPNYRKGLKAMELCVRNNPKVILIVTFGTIARADVMAEGIVSAMAALKPPCLIVTCIRGTGEEDAAKTLAAAGLDPLVDTEKAVKRAVEFSRSGGRP
ncbi:MAG: succinyl-CoA synthetase beta subunit [Spirochaetes bacterium]|nr:MAG: succinyl-CoA synthetase beta subunit [Spirochaetota bacterium]